MLSNNLDSAAVQANGSAPNVTTSQTEGSTMRSAERTEPQDGLTASTPSANEPTTRDASPSSDAVQTPRGPVRTDTTTALAQALVAPATTPPPVPSTIPQKTRRQSTAIGPSTEQPDPMTKDEDPSGPRLELTLLLTNGARHPFILDTKYLSKRNVEAQGNDPFNLSVYKLKELILREWREEWESKPSSPSYIRLISFGKLLDDKSALKDLKFNRTDRNVVHMTIKPQDFIDDDDGRGAKTGFSSGRAGDENRSPGCRCVIM